MCLSPTESDARLRSKSKRETKNSCHCSTPLTEFMLRVQSLKPKPNQIPLETSTDFVSVTFPPAPETVSPSSRQRMSSLQIAPKPPGTSAGFPGLPRRAQGQGASAQLAGWKTFAGQSCAGAARGGWTRSAALPPCGRRRHRCRPLAVAGAGLEPGARRQSTSAGTRWASGSWGGACRRRSRGLATGSSQWRRESGGACAGRHGGERRGGLRLCRVAWLGLGLGIVLDLPTLLWSWRARSSNSASHLHSRDTPLPAPRRGQRASE